MGWQMVVALGISPKQHAAIRPIFNRAFDIRGDRFASVQSYVEKTVKELFARRAEEGALTHTDIKVWFHKVINKITFDREVDDAYCLRFIGMQGKMLTTQIISQIVPKRMYGMDPLKIAPTRREVIGFVDEYKALIKEQYADLLKDQDCSPSVSCEDQAAYGIFDAFLAAGGVSLPGTILQTLAVVFSKDKSNPAGKPVTYAAEEALQIYWEAIRMFPPVVVLPYWSPRPKCAGLSVAETSALNAPDGKTAPCPLGKPDKHTGYPPVNQYGDEAAVDNSVAGGRMNRNCPGKALALLMGKTFLEMFRPSDWSVDHSKPIKINMGGPYVADFTMYLKEKVEKCRTDVCKCQEKGLIGRVTCRRCVKKKCYI
eukprot:IDg11132t1